MEVEASRAAGSMIETGEAKTEEMSREQRER